MGIAISSEGDTTVITVAADLVDVPFCHRLGLMLDNLSDTCRQVVLDCRGIKAIDQRALIQLVALAHAVHARRKAVALSGVSEMLAQRLEKLLCRSYLPWFGSQEDALKALAKRAKG